MENKTGTFTDIRDGKVYKTVIIGNQEWMAENLAYKTDSGCWPYGNKSDAESNIKKYGYLYNWETAMEVCPSDWRIPTKNDFEILLNNFGDQAEKAYKALIPSGSSGFSALLGGAHGDTGNFCFGKSSNTDFWSSSKDDPDSAWELFINKNDQMAEPVSRNKKFGFSVRCVKDSAK